MTAMSLLGSVNSPEDLRALDPRQRIELAAEVREFLIEKVAVTGGHLGPNLGVVELTLALHTVFDSPRDAIIFDTGHQCYVHKIVTGRRDGFDGLRQKGGLTGYQERAESEHDWVESSHASAALSYADGLAKAFALDGADRHVVAVVGDGALTGGMCWEALNNIADADRPLVIVVNDNGRSYAPTIGGLARHLRGLRLRPSYERAMRWIRGGVEGVPVVGEPLYKAMHGMKAGIKDLLSPQVMFSDLGLKYVGPIDGHDLDAMTEALEQAKEFGGSVIVHAVTRKGMGYAHAENDDEDQMHSTGAIDPVTGKPRAAASQPDWTSVFSAAIVEHGARRRDVVAITAAMPGPTGLLPFAERFPDRLFDVGIAEQHALTSAAGLALGGKHPVVAIYATFLNRAFDQLLMDVALLRQPVTIVLDRAGVTGSDGPSHNGMWDLSLAGIVPGLRVAAPRDAARLREELAEALDVSDGPTLLRFPKGPVPEDLCAVERLADGVDVLRRPGSDESRDVLIVAVGAFGSLAIATAERLGRQGIGATVVDPRWVLPVPDSIVGLARTHRMVVTLEDNGLAGGVGAAVSTRLRAEGVDVPQRDRGIAQRFLAHASRGEVLAELGLTPQDLARGITAEVAGMSGELRDVVADADESR